MSQTQSRMTKQRMVILEELQKTYTHPTADELYARVRERLPRISLGTVYRNLDFLAESGVINKLEAAGSIRRYDGLTRRHQHIRCTECGRIGDIMVTGPEPQIEGVRAEGFTVTCARVEYEGLCDACAAKGAGAFPGNGNDEANLDTECAHV